MFFGVGWVIVLFVSSWVIVLFVSGWAIAFWVRDWAIAFCEGLGDRVFERLGDRVLVGGWAIVFFL